MQNTLPGSCHPCQSTCTLHCIPEAENHIVHTPYPETPSDAAGPPSDSQAVVILAEIETEKTELATARFPDFGLEGAVKRGTCRRKSLRDSVDTHKAVLSAMRHLPNEILLEIFQYSFVFSDFNDFCASSNAPWTVSQVCSHWRAVALASPRLWSYFDLPNSTPATWLRYDAYLTGAPPVQLERAGRTPIIIDFGYGSPRPDVSNLFLSVASQWADATLEVNYLMSAHVSSHSFSALKKLTLKTWELVQITDDINMVASLPALNYLHVKTSDDFQDRTFPRNLSLPWAQLQECDLDYPALHDLLWILPQLSHGTVLTTFGVRETSAPPSGLHTTAIKSLTLLSCDPNVLSNLLIHLTAPHLETFILDPDEAAILESHRASGNHIRDFLARSASNLLDLALDAPLDADVVAQILELSHIRSVVKYLSFGHTMVSPRIIAALVGPLPALRDLVLCPTDLDGLAVLEALGKKVAAGAKQPRLRLA
ncbi:hypothetical protein C8R46DRAFT_1120351 [Mycena filopes]|nr:hypothetical protein C8R46DRAFT_1120351 [Mycena filopes]